ncbi:MAG: CPBP family intramembrane metalloprotease [Saprospiraceae bacterium]|nr:CPBP family intramembrane metalloprotease [Saprospiraceae bacterium]
MSILSTPIAYLIIVLPLFFIGKKQQPPYKEYIIAFTIYAILDMLVTALPIEFPAFDFMHLDMNWSGKIYSYILAILFFLFYKKIPLAQFGMTTKQNEGSLRFSLWTTATFILVMFAYCIFIGRYQTSIENILFQLTMPSVVEEITCRGILLTLLSMVFVPNYKIGKINFGMGAIITAVIFGLWHGLYISNAFEISMSWVPFIYTGIIGFVLALVKERTGSLLFPIIIHIIVNMMPQTMGYLF